MVELSCNSVCELAGWQVAKFLPRNFIAFCPQQFINEETASCN
jgi:hypothetical protein